MTGEIVLRRGSLLPFLREVATERPSRPAAPAGLCVLSGGIVARNLTDRLAAEGMPADLAAVTTVEDLAADLVAAGRASGGHPATRERPTTLDRPVRTAAIGRVLETATDRDTPLGRFARRVPFDGSEVLDAVAAELNEYHRCTDAASDAGHATLLDAVDAVADDHPFAAEATREHAAAFRAIDGRLRDLVAASDGGSGEAGEGTFPARSHLVRAARGHLPGAWPDAVGDPDWVAVATVSALDNPTMRLLFSVAGTGTPVHLFAGAGTADYFGRRLRAAAGDRGVEVRTPDGRSDAAAGDPEMAIGAAALLSAAADHDPARDPPGVRTVAAPDERREVEAALRAARRAGGSTLLVARDAGAYETPLRDVALTADRPYHVETRRAIRSVPAYRAVAATVELLVAAAAGAVSPRAVVDPLRLGACLPADPDAGGEEGADGGDEGRGEADPAAVTAREGWPLPAGAVRDLEALLGRGTTPEKPLSAYRESVATAADDLGAAAPPDPFARALAFLDWVDSRRRSPPSDGATLRRTVERLVGAFRDGAAGRDLRRVEGVAVETGRARAAAKHPVYYADRVRAAAGEAGEAYDWFRAALDRPADWETALLALRRGTGAGSYGVPNDDADALELVDAGNAYFRRADRVLVLGLAAERFPGTPRGSAFLRRPVREAVYRRASEAPYAYLDCEPAGFERDLDAYGATLRAAREGVTLVRPYKDGEGRDVAPSPFLDAVAVPEARHTRVDLGDWIVLGDGPGPDAARAGSGGGSGSGTAGSGETPDAGADWDRLFASLPPKERLRALARYADRPAGRGPGRAALERLARRVDDPGDRRRVRRRIARFRRLLEADDD